MKQWNGAFDRVLRAKEMIEQDYVELDKLELSYAKSHTKKLTAETDS